MYVECKKLDVIHIEESTLKTAFSGLEEFFVPVTETLIAVSCSLLVGSKFLHPLFKFVLVFLHHQKLRENIFGFFEALALQLLTENLPDPSKGRHCSVV